MTIGERGQTHNKHWTVSGMATPWCFCFLHWMGFACTYATKKNGSGWLDWTGLGWAGLDWTGWDGQVRMITSMGKQSIIPITYCQ